MTDFICLKIVVIITKRDISFDFRRAFHICPIYILFEFEKM